MYGPKGVAALWAQNPQFISPLLLGGGQEYGKRSSTENVPGIVGFGVAADILLEKRKDDFIHVSFLRDQLMACLKDITGAIQTGNTKSNSPQHVHVRFGVPSDLVVIALDKAGIATSTGSACQIRAAEASYVLRAIGLNEIEATHGVRFSLGRYTLKEDMALTCIKLKKVIPLLL